MSEIANQNNSESISPSRPKASSDTSSGQNGSKILLVLSNTFSGVFLPLFVSTYAFILAISLTPLSQAPFKSRLISAMIVFALTALIPLGAIFFLMRKGKVSDVSINNPRERKIPYLITIICYFATALFLGFMPRWLPMFFVGAAISAIIASIITLKYKISAHTMSIGGLCSMLIFIGINHLTSENILPWVCVAILLSGAVGSARVYLGRHTSSQVYSGWLLGLIVTFIFMSI